MLKTLIGAVALSSFLALPALAAERTIRIGVGGLTCPSCPFIVSSALKKVPGTTVDDFQDGPEKEHGVFVVTYDDAATSPEVLLEAVTANGYPAELLPQTDEDPAS